MDNKTFFKQANFGLMVHFGLYSMLAGEYNGQRLPFRYGAFNSEWIQHGCKIPNAEYSKLVNAFNPIYFNADEWVKMAVDAGMTYVVVTSKHHDGFALFNSKWDDFNSVKSPFKRDIIEEIANACVKNKLKLGIYYSQEMDWHDPNGGGGLPWTNTWDFPDEDKKDFSKCFEGKTTFQMKELLTNYGDLFLLWCDNPVQMTQEQSIRLYDMIKKYQPNCLVNSRIGNGIGDYRSCGDNVIEFDREKEEAKPDEINARSMEYAVGGRTGLYECPATIGYSWGYCSYDQYKNASELIATKENLNKHGVNYLLNVGPDGLGRFPVCAIDILKSFGQNK